jgi:hypothetical protein
MIVRRSIRTIVMLGVVVIVGAGTYAFTASNTVTAKAAGSGSGAISGFTVSAVSYSLNATNPQNIDSVNFTISPATTSLVKASLDGTNWYSCTNTAGSVACASTAPQATVATASSLTVVAQG